MANNPIVSVIVPIYNSERYIKKCVGSLFEQTLRNFEIILVDDASTDGSFELCRKLYGDNIKVKLVRHEKNLGLGATLNTGLKLATGKYICFVNATDFVLPSALKKFYNAAEKNNADVVHTAGRFELAQDDVEPVLRENLHLVWDKYSQEGFLRNNLFYKLEEHWKKGATNSAVWLCFCRKEFLDARRLTFLNIAAADETFSFALFCMVERYYILHASFYIKRKLIDTAETARKKFPEGVRSMLIGSMYIEKFLNKVPRFNGYDTWRENLLAAFFHRLMLNYTDYRRENFLSDVELNALAEKSLTPFFANGRNFVKYFFNGYHAFRRQAQVLLEKSNDLNAQVMSLFTRMELAAKKIVFVNFNGRGYGCNPKYIAEEILRQNLPYDLVWLVSDLEDSMPDKIRKVFYGNIDSIYELATAKVIVTNTKNLLPFPGKKHGQFLIMTWHSAQDFKLVERDAEEKLPADYVKESKSTSSMTDLMMAGTREQLDEFQRAFWYSGKILQCGLPRNDIFSRKDKKIAAQIRKALNVPRFSKVVMYAPTVRDKTSADVYNFDVRKLLDTLEEKFGGEWTLLVRFHPKTVAPKNFIATENIIDVTNYPDVQELILISDVLISDYSSMIYDAMLSGKKIFIYAKDFDNYTAERGFKPLYFELPLAINRTEAALLKCIETFDAAEMEPKVKNFLQTIEPFDTGHASEEVVTIIKSIIDND